MRSISAAQLTAVVAICGTAQASVQTALNVASADALMASPFEKYAALGDSYSAGLYANPSGRFPICECESPFCGDDTRPRCTSAPCSRNDGAYGYQFANEQTITDFRFLACSGADVNSTRTCQVPFVDPNSRLITFTAGGNNEDAFASVVAACVYKYSSSGCDSAISSATAAVQGLNDSMNAFYDAIRQQAKTAQIFHLGYAQFWPNQTFSCEGFFPKFLEKPTKAQKDSMNTLVVSMNNAIQWLATRSKNKINFISVDDAYDTHRLCDVGGDANTYFRWRLIDRDETEWNYHNGVFHPNLNGQNAYLYKLNKALGLLDIEQKGITSDGVKPEL